MGFNMDNEIALIEAIIFLESEPVDEEALVRISGLSREVVDKALESLRERLDQPQSGLELSKLSGGWVFIPKRGLWEYLRGRYGRKNEQKLSRAALETLAIIAYSQPITRAEIESIRGVAADNMIRLLQERGFVREVGKKDAPGKPCQYGTTKEFLKFFRLASIADLPRLEDLDEERFELDPEE
jgi:segregation and condensation protein B